MEPEVQPELKLVQRHRNNPKWDRSLKTKLLIDIMRLRERGLKYHEIAVKLNQHGVRTPVGGGLTGQTISNLVNGNRAPKNAHLRDGLITHAPGTATVKYSEAYPRVRSQIISGIVLTGIGVLLAGLIVSFSTYWVPRLQ